MASLAEAIIETFLPSCCAICGRALPSRGSRAGVCATCWESVAAHTPACPICGDPETIPGRPCLACQDDPPPWTAAASFGPYGGRLRDLILLLKQGKRDELAAPLAALLAGALERSGWPASDAVVPVPMWWGRRLRRGFNQAALLARGLARRLDLRAPDLLRRRRGGPQVGRARAQRLRLSSRSFIARRPAPPRVVLVDDVLTTGATAAACTRALQRAGATEVRVLTLARTPRPGRIP
jgi:ComF family protein